MSKYPRNAELITIYQDLGRYTCQVGATQLQNGDVVVVFNETRGLEHLDFDHISLIRSRDNGRTWDPATKSMIWQATDTFGSDTPSIMQLANDELIVNFVMTAHVYKKGIYEDVGPQSETRMNNMREKDGVWLMRSSDDGHTWSPPYKASVTPLRWGQPIDEVLELPNGIQLMVASGKMFSRPYDAPETRRSFLMRSDNQGYDWEYYATVAYDASNIVAFWEPALGRTVDGTLVCAMRSVYEPRGRHQKIWMSYSKNDGESWSAPEPTNLWGYPADLTLLQDGRMLCTYGYRRDPFGVRGCISADGMHWDVANEFIIREGGEGPSTEKLGGPYWHIGYPTSIQLQNGTIFSVDHVWTQEPPYVQYVVGVLWDLEG